MWRCCPLANVTTVRDPARGSICLGHLGGQGTGIAADARAHLLDTCASTTVGELGTGPTRKHCRRTPVQPVFVRRHLGRQQAHAVAEARTQQSAVCLRGRRCGPAPQQQRARPPCCRPPQHPRSWGCCRCRRTTCGAAGPPHRPGWAARRRIGGAGTPAAPGPPSPEPGSHEHLFATELTIHQASTTWCHQTASAVRSAVSLSDSAAHPTTALPQKCSAGCVVLYLPSGCCLKRQALQAVPHEDRLQKVHTPTL